MKYAPSFNPSTGNMYVEVQFTCNPYPGICPHGCPWCYAPRIAKQRKLEEYFDPPHLKKDYPWRPIDTMKHIKNCTVFMCSMFDIGAESNDDEDIRKVIKWCKTAGPDVTIIFQTKDLRNFSRFMRLLEPHWLVGTTIEAWPEPEWYGDFCSAPSMAERLAQMEQLTDIYPDRGFFVNVEPALAFYPIEFAEALARINLRYVSFGMLTGPIPEGMPKNPFPSKGDIVEFVEHLHNKRPGMPIHIKRNTLSSEKRRPLRDALADRLTRAGGRIMERKIEDDE